MNLDTLRQRINSISSKLDNEFRYFATLVPFVYIQGELHLLFEVRSAKLRRQPGEVCFPGGKKEPNETFVETAIRETMEELNISRKNIEVIGQLPSVSTHYNNFIFPFAGILHDVDVSNINFNKGEVDNIFTVPLDFFIKNPPQHHYIETHPQQSKDFPYHLLPNGKDYSWFKGKHPVYFYEYQSYIIWGLTARTIKNLIDILKDI